MADVLLREYVDELQRRIRAGHYSDAFTLGQHILSYYPKHLETYTLLAQASLQTGDLAGATDLFRRVLGADPENVIALVGMALIQESQDQLDEALWYLERAFEVQPSNPEVRREILHLREAYYGAPATRLELTQGGLARLYARQGQYPHAINEFNKLLRGNGKRYDLRVALAECLYRAGRADEAGALAQDLLTDAPFALKLNLILGTLWSDNGVSDGETFLQRAQALDPENRVARDLIGAQFANAPSPRLPALGADRTMPVPTDTFAPPEEETSTFGAQETLTDEDAERAREMFRQLEDEGKPFEQEIAASAMALDQIESAKPVAADLEKDFLQDWAALVEPGPGSPQQGSDKIRLDESPTTTGTGQAPVQATAAPPSPEQSPIVPSQVAVASSLAAQLDKSNQPAPTRRAHPSIPKVRPFVRGAAEKIPTWLRLDPGSSTVASAASLATEASATAVQTQTPQNIDDRPTWLIEAEKATSETLSPQTKIELPGWLHLEEHKETAAVTESTELTPDVIVDLPDWLKASRSETPPGATVQTEVEVAPAPASKDAPSTLVNLPDWLLEPQAPSESPASAVGIPPESASNESMTSRAETASANAPEWFSEVEAPAPAVPPLIEPTESSPIAPKLPPTELPNWLQDAHSPEARVSSSETETASTTGQFPPPPREAEPASPGATPDKAEPAPARTSVPPARSEEKAAVDSQVLLGQARERRANGDLKGALDLYERVMHRRPNYLDEVIVDLQAVSRAENVPTSIHRLLGEAYAMAGRFKEALEQYRIAMGK